MLDWQNRFRALRTSVRLSLQFSLLYALLSAFVFIGAYLFTSYEVQDWLSDQMEGDAATFAAIFEADGLEGLQSSVDILGDVSFESARIYQLQDADGAVLAGNIATVLPDNDSTYLSAHGLNLTAPMNDEVSGYWMREDKIGNYLLFQGSGDHLVAEVLEAVGTAFGVGFFVVVGLGLLLGIRVGQATEARITKISETLSLAASGDLSARVAAHPNQNDDLSRISTGINTALDQLKRLLESQEQISNDIAHDLRTPLQRLRQRLEAMRDGDDSSVENLDAAMHQVDGIIATFNALLRIAQIQAQDRNAKFDTIDLNDTIENVVDLYGPTAEDAQQSLIFSPSALPARIQGDAHMLTQLFANLIENAVLHCPKGATILVATQVTDGRICVCVTDDGPGIAVENRELIFERFVRVDTSRTTSGNGLGLALAKAIVERHGASISVEDRDIGTEIMVTF